MSKKRKSQRKKRDYMQRPMRQNMDSVKSITGLKHDEIGVAIDPTNPSKIGGYLLPDGKRLQNGASGAPQDIPSIIHPQLIITSKENKATRSTMASRLGEMLIVAENLFGQRDHRYTFLGIEFTNDAPHIHFEPNKNMIMQLHMGAMLEPMETYAEMAHECIHLLSPCPQRPVTILEEGIAEVFAYIYMRDTMKHELKPKPPGTAYHEAAELVAMLMSINPYGIKQMREEEPTISLITKSLIWKHYPMLDEGVAARLARTFVSDNCDDPDILAWYEKESSETAREQVAEAEE